MFVALGIQHAMRMRHTVICGLSFGSTIYISTLSHKKQDFGEKIFLEHKMCVPILSTAFSESFLILRRTITYSECMFVAWGIQQAMRMRHIVVCGL